MLVISVLLLFVVLASLFLLLPALGAREIYRRYRGSRAVTCPESSQQVAVSIDARHAAVTGINGHPDLRLSDCTRWPERARCAQPCMPEALRTEPYTQGEVKIETKQIYHLPVLLAAFASWYIGAVWHSHYLFRSRWREAVGFTPQQLKEIVEWYSPHLLTAAACLLFAYGVAWLLAVRKRTGIAHGILTGLLLWGALVLVSLMWMAVLPHDLLMIEAGYTALAAVVAGAIIGGLGGKLVMPAEITPRA